MAESDSGKGNENVSKSDNGNNIVGEGANNDSN